MPSPIAAIDVQSAVVATMNWTLRTDECRRSDGFVAGLLAVHAVCADQSGLERPWRRTMIAPTGWSLKSTRDDENGVVNGPDVVL
jgi:hypothetical protein